MENWRSGVPGGFGRLGGMGQGAEPADCCGDHRSSGGDVTRRESCARRRPGRLVQVQRLLLASKILSLRSAAHVEVFPFVRGTMVPSFVLPSYKLAQGTQEPCLQGTLR